MARYATLQQIDNPNVQQLRVGDKLFAPGQEVDVTEDEQERLKALSGFHFTFRSDRKQRSADKNGEQD